MKAIRIHGPNKARFEDVDTPTPDRDDVLIRVRAAGICRTDVEVYDGSMFYVASGMTALPLIPGHEWSGEVVETGQDVTGFSVGDLVTGECSVGCQTCVWCRSGRYNHCPNRTETGLLNRSGGFAETIAFPQHFLHRADGLTAEQAAMIEPTGISLFATRQAQITPADRVAVIGVGTIGLLAVQTARTYGAHQIIAIDLDEDRLAVAANLGADATVHVDAGDVVGQVQELTRGEMVDVVLEAAGQPQAFETVQSVVAPAARVALMGLSGGKKTQVNFDSLVVGGVRLIGCLGSPNVWPEAISLYQRGLIDIEPLITHRLPLSEFEQGIGLMQ